MAGAGNRAGKGGSSTAKAVEHKVLAGDPNATDSLSALREKLAARPSGKAGNAKALTARYKPALAKLEEASARLRFAQRPRNFASSAEQTRALDLAQRGVAKARADLAAQRTQRSIEQNRSRKQGDLFTGFRSTKTLGQERREAAVAELRSRKADMGSMRAKRDANRRATTERRERVKAERERKYVEQRAAAKREREAQAKAEKERVARQTAQDAARKAHRVQIAQLRVKRAVNRQNREARRYRVSYHREIRGARAQIAAAPKLGKGEAYIMGKKGPEAVKTMAQSKTAFIHRSVGYGLSDKSTGYNIGSVNTKAQAKRLIRGVESGRTLNRAVGGDRRAQRAVKKYLRMVDKYSF